MSRQKNIQSRVTLETHERRSGTTLTHMNFWVALGLVCNKEPATAMK